jgi:hypothetical protein
MPNAHTGHDKPLHMDARQEGDRLVVLTPDDEDRFVRSCKWVVEASQLGLSRDVWLRELYGLLSHVQQWAETLADRVKACLAMERDDQIAIFVVPIAGRYDFELSELLTALDLELAEKFRTCPCDVLQMPDKPLDEIEELSGKGLAILIYGYLGSAQEEMAP